MSNEPGNDELKAKIDRAYEKATRRFIELGDTEASSGKRIRADPEHPGIGAPIPEAPVSPTPAPMDAGTKRTASKQGTRSGSKVEPEPKRSRDAMELQNNMNIPKTLKEESQWKNVENSENGAATINNIEVCEFYSVPRVVPRLIGKHVKSGKSIDITHADEDGHIWDFTKSAMREKARRYVNEKKPLFTTGSPPFDPFSTMQNLNGAKCDPIKRQHKIVAGRIRLAFCTELYQMQLSAGRYFLHEHPLTASSWKENCINRIASKMKLL